MDRISIYFRDEQGSWEMNILSFEPGVYDPECWRKLIELGCNFRVFGNSAISKNIDYFLSNELVRGYKFDATGAGRYYYIMRKEKGC